MSSTMQVLTGQEVLREVRPSRAVRDDGYYLKVFVINPKQNHAADPIPFKISPRALEAIAASAVGRPFIVGPNPKKHVRGATGDPEEILRIQKRYAIGEFIGASVKPESGNAYGIVEVFPEFVDDVKKKVVRGKPLPPFTSPMVEVRKTNMLGEITDGRILHVQAVSQSGYEPEIARIVGACDGMLDQCMVQLRNLGAAGALKAWQEKISRRDERLASMEKKLVTVLGASGGGTGAPDGLDRLSWALQDLRAHGDAVTRKRLAEKAVEDLERRDRLLGASGRDQEEENYTEIFDAVRPSWARPRSTDHATRGASGSGSVEEEDHYTRIFDSVRKPHGPQGLGGPAYSPTDLNGLMDAYNDGSQRVRGAAGDDEDRENYLDVFESVR